MGMGNVLMLRGPQTPQRDDTERKTAGKRPNARPTEATLPSAPSIPPRFRGHRRGRGIVHERAHGLRRDPCSRLAGSARPSCTSSSGSTGANAWALPDPANSIRRRFARQSRDRGHGVRAERRERARHLIELGGLVQKADLVELVEDGWTRAFPRRSPPSSFSSWSTPSSPAGPVRSILAPSSRRVRQPSSPFRGPRRFPRGNGCRRTCVIPRPRSQPR